MIDAMFWLYNTNMTSVLSNDSCSSLLTAMFYSNDPLHPVFMEIIMFMECWGCRCVVWYTLTPTSPYNDFACFEGTWQDKNRIDEQIASYEYVMIISL